MPIVCDIDFFCLGLSLLCGTLLGLCIAWPWAEFLVLVALVPLLWLMREARPLSALGWGLVCTQPGWGRWCPRLRLVMCAQPGLVVGHMVSPGPPGGP